MRCLKRALIREIYQIIVAPHRQKRSRTPLDIYRSINAAAESFFSTLEHEVLSRHHFSTREEARTIVVKWAADFYNGIRRHSRCGMISPIDYENTATPGQQAA